VIPHTAASAGPSLIPGDLAPLSHVVRDDEQDSGKDGQRNMAGQRHGKEQDPRQRHQPDGHPGQEIAGEEPRRVAFAKADRQLGQRQGGEPGG
jgi:hypothetical protein